MKRKVLFLALFLLLNLSSVKAQAQVKNFGDYLKPVNPKLQEEIKDITTVNKRLEQIIGELEEEAQHPDASQEVKVDLAAFLLRKVAIQAEKPYEDNEPLLIEVSELIPGDFHLEYLWGDVLFCSGDYQNSMHHYESALSKEPENMEVIGKCGLTYFNLLQYEKALDYVKQYLEKYPKTFYLNYIAGCCNFELAEFDEAIEYWEKALELAVDDNNKKAIEELIRKAKEKSASDGESSQDEDQHFVINFAGNSKDDLGDIAFDSLNDIYDDVTTLLDCDPDVKVNVNFFLTDEYYNGNKDWSAASTRGLKIDVPLKSGYKSEEYVKGLLAHEFTHAIINLKTNNRAPLWVHEGLAQYEEFKTQFGSEENLRSDYVGIYENEFKENGFFIPLDKIPNYMKSSDRKDVSRAYIASWIAIRCMTDLYGESSVSTLLGSMSKGNDIRQAVSDVTGGSYNDFQDEIKQWVANQ